MSDELRLEFEPNEIFPTRLSPFEEYLYDDDRDRLPMTEELFWFFSGRVEPELLAVALRRLAAREPLLFAVVARRRGRLCWTFPKEPVVPSLEIRRTDASIDDWRSGSAPLRRFRANAEPAARFRLIVASDGFVLQTSFHHALTDGIGVARLVGTWIAIYRDERLRREKAGTKNEVAAETESGTAAPCAVENLSDPRLLLERENFHLSYPEKTSFWVDCGYVVSETALWFFRRPWSLSPLFRRLKKTRQRARADVRPTNAETPRASSAPFENFGESTTRPSLFWRTGTPELFEKYRRAAKERGVSFNSAFVRDVFVGLENWRKTAENPRLRRRFRTIVPTNLRNDAFHSRTPAANMLGYVFLDRFSDECRRDDDFLRALDAQMQEIRRWSVGSFFLDGLRFFRLFPGSLKLLTSRLFCHSTVVFSNTGDLCRAAAQSEFRDAKSIFIDDETKAIRVAGGPPVRPNTPIAIGLVGCGGELVLSFCVDPNVVADVDREKLIDFCWAEIRKTADSQPPRPPKP